MLGGKSARNPDADVLEVAAPALNLPEVEEQFTISFKLVRHEMYMSLAWDQTEVLVAVNP